MLWSAEAVSPRPTRTRQIHEFLGGLFEVKRGEAIRRISDQALRGVDIEINIVEKSDDDAWIRPPDQLHVRALSVYVHFNPGSPDWPHPRIDVAARHGAALDAQTKRSRNRFQTDAISRSSSGAPSRVRREVHVAIDACLAVLTNDDCRIPRT